MHFDFGKYYTHSKAIRILPFSGEIVPYSGASLDSDVRTAGFVWLYNLEQLA